MFPLLQELYYLKLFISACNLSSISKISKQFFDFIGYSNLFLAVVVFASTIQGGFIFHNTIPSTISFAFLNFTAAFFLYNLQRIYQSTQPTTDERLLWYRKNKKWIFTIALLFILIFSQALLTIASDYYQGIIVYGMCGILSLLYFLPPFNLRKTKFLKQFAIAFIWVVVCIVIPFMYRNSTYTGLTGFTKDVWLYILSQFCFISALCIPFDIRDFNKDKKEGTKSIPVALGIKASKIIAIGLIAIYFALAFFIEVRSLVIIRGLIAIISVIVISNANEKRHRYYFIYLTDGVILLQSLLLYLL